METLSIFFLNRPFLDIVEKNQKPVFKIRKFLPFLYINLKWRTKFQIFWASYTRLWLVECYTLFRLQNKYKIRLVSILRKREDQALISISTILKFSVQVT